MSIQTHHQKKERVFKICIDIGIINSSLFTQSLKECLVDKTLILRNFLSMLSQMMLVFYD
jgi:hypothetical protein